jgi:hypothetical protein
LRPEGRAEKRTLECGESFLPTTTWLARPATGHPTDIAIVDFDLDGWPDILESNGGDEAQEPLVLVYNERAREARPAWQSQPDHYVRLAAGDLNHDGYPDIVASVASPRTREIREAAHVYLNHRGTFSPQPEYRVTGFSSLALGLGDFNGDGWLDLSLGQYDSPDAPTGQSWQYVYFNRGGAFDFSGPSWKALIDGDTSLHTVADFDQDGNLDLVAATATSTWGFEFRGVNEAGERNLQATPSVLPNYDGFGWGMAAFAAAGRLSSDATQQLGLIVSFNTEPFSAKATSFVAFDSGRRTYPWTSNEANIGGGVALCDVDDDHRLDLLGAQWTAEKPGGPYGPAPVRLYCADDQGFLREGIEVGGETFIGQGLAVGDLDRAGLVAHSYRKSQVSSPVVITLPHAQIHSLSKVTWGQNDITQQVARVHGANWISVPVQANPTDTLEVYYQSSTSLDIVVADRHPSRNAQVPVIYHR